MRSEIFENFIPAISYGLVDFRIEELVTPKRPPVRGGTTIARARGVTTQPTAGPLGNSRCGDKK
jgi:hypothetical protein